VVLQSGAAVETFHADVAFALRIGIDRRRGSVAVVMHEVGSEGTSGDEACSAMWAVV